MIENSSYARYSYPFILYKCMLSSLELLGLSIFPNKNNTGV